MAQPVAQVGHRVVRSSGVGSFHRSRKSCPARRPPGRAARAARRARAGAARTRAAIRTACGSPRCSASSRRLWHRSMPPTNATSRSGRPDGAARRASGGASRRGGPAGPAAPRRRPPRSLAEVAVLLLAVLQRVEVRAPHQALDHHAALRRPGRTARRRSGRPSRSRSSGSPRQSVKNRWSPALSASTSFDQPVEVRRAVHQRLGQVALAPRGQPEAGLPRSSAVRNQSSIRIRGACPHRRCPATRTARRETGIPPRNGRLPSLSKDGNQVKGGPDEQRDHHTRAGSRTREPNSEQGLLLAVLIMVILGVVAIFLVTA